MTALPLKSAIDWRLHLTTAVPVDMQVVYEKISAARLSGAFDEQSTVHRRFYSRTKLPLHREFSPRTHPLLLFSRVPLP